MSAEPQPARDLRSPLAKARDEWLASDDGKLCMRRAAHGKHLENCLTMAFLAGAQWATKQPTTELEVAQPQAVARQSPTAFDIWWHNEGSGMPPMPGEDAETHVRRICKIAWENGEYVAREHDSSNNQQSTP